MFDIFFVFDCQRQKVGLCAVVKDKTFQINWTNQSKYGKASLAEMKSNMVEGNLLMDEETGKREDTVWSQRKEDVLVKLWQDRPCSLQHQTRTDAIESESSCLWGNRQEAEYIKYI